MKKYLSYAILLVIIGIGVGFYMYNKPHQNIKNSKADFKIEANQLFATFDENESEANTKYLDKIIEVKGTVREVSVDEEGNINVMLDSESELSGVICQLDNLTTHKKTNFSPGEKVTFKGICTGMLMDVVMVRCVEIENP
jgi:uncharacterized protein HemX